MRWVRVAVVLLPAAVAPAAQLGRIAVSPAAAGVTRITIPVAGKFTFTRETHDEKIVIQLKDVHPASAKTDVIDVSDGPVIRVRVGNHEAYTTVAMDLRMRSDATVSESDAGLVVDVRGTGALAATTPPKTVVRPPSKKQSKAGAKVEEGRVDLGNIPQVPPSYIGRDSLREPLAAAAEPRTETPVKAATPPEPAVPQPVVPKPPERVSTVLSEKDYFPDTSAGPSLRPVNESQVDIATDIVLFTAQDKENAVGGVLKRYNGFIAFGSPKDQGYVKHMFSAGDWSMRVLSEPLVSLAEYRAFQFADEAPGIVGELRQKHRIPADLVAYAVFPDPFDRVLLQEIRRFAARQGQSGKVVAARFAFSLANPQGVTVLQVRVGSVGRR